MQYIFVNEEFYLLPIKSIAPKSELNVEQTYFNHLLLIESIEKSAEIRSKRTGERSIFLRNFYIIYKKIRQNGQLQNKVKFNYTLSFVDDQWLRDFCQTNSI